METIVNKNIVVILSLKFAKFITKIFDVDVAFQLLESIYIVLRYGWGK